MNQWKIGINWVILCTALIVNISSPELYKFWMPTLSKVLGKTDLEWKIKRIIDLMLAPKELIMYTEHTPQWMTNILEHLYVPGTILSPLYTLTHLLFMIAIWSR